MAIARKHPSAAKQSRALDAIALLIADHKKVRGLFSRFEKLMDQEGVDDEKAELVKQICNELKVHIQVEEELFYWVVRPAIDDDDLIDEAEVEHAGARDLIAQIEAMQPGDELYDAKVVVLGEQIEHHVKEEEDEMFPKARKARVNTVELAEQMMERKLEIMAEMGLPSEDEDTADSGGFQRANQKPLRGKTTSTSNRL